MYGATGSPPTLVIDGGAFGVCRAIYRRVPGHNRPRVGCGDTTTPHPRGTGLRTDCRCRTARSTWWRSTPTRASLRSTSSYTSGERTSSALPSRPCWSLMTPARRRCGESGGTLPFTISRAIREAGILFSIEDVPPRPEVMRPAAPTRELTELHHPFERKALRRTQSAECPAFFRISRTHCAR